MGTDLEWNKEYEIVYRKHKRDAKTRMNSLAASRKDRYDDVTTLAFRKNYKQWDSIENNF